MVKRKDSFWEHAKEIENGRFFICKFCNKRFSGGVSRFKSHLSGFNGRDIQICLQVPKAIQLEAKQALQAIDTPTKRAKNMAASNDVLEGEIISGSSSSHTPNLCKGQDQCKVDKQLAKLITLEGISYDVVQSPLFKDFINCVANNGPGYELPSSLTLESRLMPDLKKEVENYVTKVIKYSAQTGCTLMYNTWRNSSTMDTLVDIFAYTPIGVAYIALLDNKLCFEEIVSSIIESIGPTNVVQFIFNDCRCYIGEFKSTKDMRYEKYPWIYQTPCANHGFRSLLNNIYNVPFVSIITNAAKWIVLYIYKHKVNVPSLRRVQAKKDSIASGFFMLMSLLEVESELKALQVSIVTLSSDWGKSLNGRQAIELFKGAHFIDYLIHCKEFWSRAKMIRQVMQPLFQAICLVQCDGPTSGYLYEMMERLQDAIKQCRDKQCCDSYQAFADDICKILDDGQSNIIHEIHVVAAFLNPIYMCSEKFKENVKMMDGVKNIMTLLVAVEEREAFMSQVKLYRTKDSSLFTTQAMMMLETYQPHKWWELCGNHLPVLQKYAIRILSQPCTCSLCKRYELPRSDLNDLDFKVNTMMMERYKSLDKQPMTDNYKSQKTQMMEQIILDKLAEVFADDCDNNYETSFEDLTKCVADGYIKDATGSWMDRCPERPFDISEIPFVSELHLISGGGGEETNVYSFI
ncbi:uncharacterized protein LOC133880419 [Alnus glutinosa]|uniref:uncharacterized protein LOC133880419 n=1 Tax=Alnus glutinosa TaxID=3517 RepID=UPI002D793C86|nr:uncharacterized protein LOC133880419 [Alnus glutinosa]